MRLTLLVLSLICMVSQSAVGGTLILRDGVGSFKIGLASEHEVLAISIDEHVGKSDTRTGQPVFEPGPGEVIVSIREEKLGGHGDHGYTLSKRAAGSTTVDLDKLTSRIEDFAKLYIEQKDEKSGLELTKLQSVFREAYSKHYTKNERVEVAWRLRSHEIKVGGITVDTKTASLKLKVYARIVRLVAPKEWAQADLFLENAAKEKRSIAIDFNP